HIDSYRAERARRPDTLRLWRKVSTREDAYWDRLYHDPDPARRAFGGRVRITLRGGQILEDEIEVADAHPRGARPFGRQDYLAKFRELAGAHALPAEQDRFLKAALGLAALPAGALAALNMQIPPALLADDGLPRGIFERRGG
ncbi:MmgE/PrpD family protein, partial [Bordetella hinzii]|nr:MmgE/PrpD family protein [Bordetella hinzii]